MSAYTTRQNIYHTRLNRPRTLTESIGVTHSRTSKITKRCAFRALSEECGTRNLARKRCDDGTRGQKKRAQLAESFWMICCSSMELLDSKRTTTCSAGRCKRQGTFGHIAQGGVGVAKRGHAKEARTRITDRLANVSPPAASLSSHVCHRNGAIQCAAAASAHRRTVQQQQAPTQTSCTATSRLPGRVGSVRERH